MNNILQTDLCGIKFQNPFILAAAPPTDELEIVCEGLEAGWAGAVLKTTSVEGNPVPLKYPMITGIHHFDNRVMAMGNTDLISAYHINEIEKRVKFLKKNFPQKVIIPSIMGGCKKDWQSLTKRLKDAGAEMVECSFSCPQGTIGERPGAMLGQNPALVEEVTGWVKSAAGNMPVAIKLTPVVTHITDIARAVKNGGGDIICASNTIPSIMGIDLDNYVPYPNIRGNSTYSGLSGQAIKPISLRIIAEISKEIDIPVTGTGGAQSWKDAAEFMLVGARNVQFCTAVMHYGFRIIDDLISGLTRYLEKQSLSSVRELIGKTLPYIKTQDQLPYPAGVVAEIDPDLCIKDDLCYIACRDGGHRAIELDENRLPKVDEEKCVGCGLCHVVCPKTGCIQLKEIEE